MNINSISFLGYLIFIILYFQYLQINIMKNSNELYDNIFIFIGYCVLCFESYNKIKVNKNNLKKIKDNKMSIGHIMLFIYYFNKVFISVEPFTKFSYFILLGHLLLIKENNLKTYGYFFSLIFYVLKIMTYNTFDLHYLLRLSGTALLSIYYLHHIEK